MKDIEEVSIDVRDVDHSWFEGVKAYLDRDFDRYYFPRESMGRLGELDPDTGDAWLIDGQVEAKAEEVEVEGQQIPCWSVGCARLIVRPASNRVRRGGDRGVSRA
jgi:hypothetical protein